MKNGQELEDECKQNHECVHNHVHSHERTCTRTLDLEANKDIWAAMYGTRSYKLSRNYSQIRVSNKNQCQCLCLCLRPCHFPCPGCMSMSRLHVYMLLSLATGTRRQTSVARSRQAFTATSSKTHGYLRTYHGYKIFIHGYIYSYISCYLARKLLWNQPS